MNPGGFFGAVRVVGAHERTALLDRAGGVGARWAQPGFSGATNRLRTTTTVAWRTADDGDGDDDGGGDGGEDGGRRRRWALRVGAAIERIRQVMRVMKPLFGRDGWLFEGDRLVPCQPVPLFPSHCLRARGAGSSDPAQ